MKHAATLCLLLLVACDRGAPQGGAASAAPASSAAPQGSGAPAASASAVSPASAAAPADASPQGAGVAEFKAAAENPACKLKTAEVANYLQRPSLGMAGRASDTTFAVVWRVDLQNNPEAQVAFAGFDAEARQVARARSIGSTRSEGLRIFEAAGEWTVAWFTSDGLTHSRPRWETVPPPEIQRLAAVGKEASENVAIAPAPSALVAAAPFGPQRDQLGVFLFAPVDPAQQPVKAVGVTHHAKNPRLPAVAADKTGYFVAWCEEDGSIKASRFDLTGKEGDASTLAPEGPKRERVGLVATGSGALALWAEGEALVARAIDANARPVGAPRLVGKGQWSTYAPDGKGALVAWLGHDGKSESQMLVARLSSDGAPSTEGVRVSDGVNALKEPPALAAAGARVGVAWTEAMGPGVGTKRAILRLIDAACIP